MQHPHTYLVFTGALDAEKAVFSQPTTFHKIRDAIHSTPLEQAPGEFHFLFEVTGIGLTVSLLRCVFEGVRHSVPDHVGEGPMGCAQESAVDWLATLQGEAMLAEMKATPAEVAPVCPPCACGGCDPEDAYPGSPITGVFIDEAEGPAADAAREALARRVMLRPADKSDETPASERRLIESEPRND